jgi:CO/xanthine dehydrogenase Mo-binding subunit
MPFSVVGRSVPRIDGEEKVSGRSQFAADYDVRRLVHARLLLSPHAHARVRRVRKDAALAVPGVLAVLTAADLPFGEDVPNVRGRCLLARDEVRFVGDPVAVVVGESEAAAADGLERLAAATEFEGLPALIDPVAAADPEAPLVQPGLARKSAERSLHAALAVHEEESRPHLSSPAAMNWSVITCALFAKSPNCASQSTSASG